jgi:hypothetical protein
MRIKKVIIKEEKVLKREWKNILFNFLTIFLSLLIVILFFKKPLLTTLFLAAVAILGLLKWKSQLTLIIFLFFGIIFGIGEIIVSNYEVWTYGVKDLGSIPIWIFILWGNTATFIYQTIIEIKKMGVKR